MRPTRIRALALLGPLSAALALAACGRDDARPTVGERVDQGVAQIERKADEAHQGIVDAGKDAGKALQGAAKELADASRDAMITAKVNAELLRDDELSATQIEVATVDGRVVLRGKAPDAASRERATRLARGVEGVVAVDNRLVVDRSS